MSAIILHRTDPAKNMRRFYRLDVQRDLFGQWCFIREWGRIGSAGQVRMVPFATATEAQASLVRQQRGKERRGYCAASRHHFNSNGPSSHFAVV
jgi:predicted DNA-binding WGR domain protein